MRNYVASVAYRHYRPLADFVRLFGFWRFGHDLEFGRQRHLDRGFRLLDRRQQQIIFAAAFFQNCLKSKAGFLVSLFNNMNPTRRQENILRKNGYQRIAGVDEVGRGAWAGPLVAAAVILPAEFKLAGLKDSKQLSPLQRENFFLKITNHALAWAVGMVSEKIIDERGLTYANLLAMEQAVLRLKLTPDYILLDAFNLKNIAIPQDGDYQGRPESLQHRRRFHCRQSFSRQFIKKIP